MSRQAATAAERGKQDLPVLTFQLQQTAISQYIDRLNFLHTRVPSGLCHNRRITYLFLCTTRQSDAPQIEYLKLKPTHVRLTRH